MRNRTVFSLAAVVLLLAIAAALLHARRAPSADPAAVASRVAAAKAHPWFWGSSHRVGDAAGEPTPVEATYHGIVVDAVTGAPLVAEVRLLLGDEPLDDVWTGGDGRFEFPPTRADARSIAAKADGYGVGVRSLAGGPGGDLRIALDPAVRISGRVIDEQSHPIAGATVFATDVEGFDWPQPQSAKVLTGDDGAFALTDAPAGGIQLTASAAGFAETKVRLGALGPGREKTDVEIRLLSGGAVEGQVRDGDGRPVAGAPVQVIRLDDDVAYDADVTILAQKPTRSGDDGRYRVDSLAPGDYAVSVDLPDRGSAHAKATIAAARTAEVDLVLADGNVADGVVVDTAGTPVASARVSLTAVDGVAYADMQPFLYGHTDANGAFSLRGARYTKSVLAAEADGARPIATPVTLPAHGLRIVLSPGASIDGHIVRADGGPWNGNHGEVQVKPPHDPGLGEPLIQDAPVRGGRFTVRDLAPGDYTLAFHDAIDGDSKPVVVTVLAGAASPVELRLERTSRVTGRVVSAGRPVVGAMIGIAAEQDMGQERLDRGTAARSGSDGRFALNLGAPGGTLFVYHPEYAPRLVPDLEPPMEGADLDVGDVELTAGRSSTSMSTKGIDGVAMLDGGDGRIVLGTPDPNGGAAEAGLQQGDQVLAVDGHSVAGMSPHDADEMTNGPPDTVVTITISRAGGPATDVPVTRHAVAPQVIMFIQN